MFSLLSISMFIDFVVRSKQNNYWNMMNMYCVQYDLVPVNNSCFRDESNNLLPCLEKMPLL